MAGLKADVLGTYTQLKERYGDVVSFPIAGQRLFVFFHPDAVREILVAQAKSFIRVPRVMRVFAQWNGSSVLIAEGEPWLRQRRLVQPAFQPRRFERYGQTMVAATERLAQSWQTEIDARGSLDVEINQAMTDLTLNIICRTMFATDVTDTSGDIARAVAILSEVAFHEMQSPFTLPNWWPSRFIRNKRWAMNVLDEAVWQIVRTRRAAGDDQGDLLSMLLAAVDEEGDGGRLDDRQVRNELMTLMLAGHDTTAAALDWVWYNLAQYPASAAACQAELAARIGNRAVAASDVPQLKFIEAVVKESLRLYPPAIGVFLRQPTADVDICGTQVPRGSLVALSSYVTQRDARWFAEPNRFLPERFLAPAVHDLKPNAYFPFGAGPRVCIGQSFAMTEMVLIVATLLRRFTVALAPDQGTVELQVHASLRPRNGVRLRWTPRA
ncbi:MAG: cytochrome P450 [Planctomycetaceae bacterium]|nr:cytochrome P450 [Planctomycetaceae bacterium]